MDYELPSLSPSSNSTIFLPKLLLQPLKKASRFFKSTFDEFIHLGNYSNSTWFFSGTSRRGGNGVLSDLGTITSEIASSTTGKARTGIPTAESKNAIVSQIDESIWSISPLSFLASWYFVSLLVMAIVVNRIYNVVPPRRSSDFHLNSLNRFSIRLPSFLLLIRGILLLSGAVFCDNFISITLSPASTLSASTPLEYAKWCLLHGARVATGEEDNTSLMWGIFIATSAAVLTESFVRALDDDLSSQNSFNIMSFSFLLHTESTKANSIMSLLHSPSLYLHLLFTLLELLLLHLHSCISPPSSSLRLLITSLFSLVSQSYLLRSLSLTIYHSSFDADQSEKSFRDGSIWMSRLFEVFLECLVGITVTLRVISEAVRTGWRKAAWETINGGEDVWGHRAHWPRADEDYIVALIKYATACIELSQITGLSNELDTLRTTSRPFVELSRHGRASFSGTPQNVPKTKNPSNGLRTEIKDIKVISEDPETPKFRKELFRLAKTIWRVWVLGFWFSMERIWRKWRGESDLDGWRSKKDEKKREELWPEEGEEEDPDWREGHHEGIDGSRNEGQNDDGEWETESEIETSRETTPGPLTSRHSTPGPAISSRPRSRSQTPFALNEITSTFDSSTSSSIFLAHLASKDGRMTRRRYREMVGEQDAQAEAETELYRPETKQVRAVKEWSEERKEEWERQRLCVVCTCEPRTIILWPCRCCCICEDCRQSMADRNSAQICPCCRTRIEGFSRLFMP